MSDLPNLYVPGAMKSGTSSLWGYLNQHPDIFMSAIKEPGFWVDDNQFPHFEPYKALFKNGKNHLYRGDASAVYMTFDHFTERIKAFTPDVKFIFILRNPVDRAWSHYWFLKGIGFAKAPFRDSFLKSRDEKLDYSRYKITNGVQYYYSFGLYGQWLNRFFKAFDAGNILIIETEDLKKNPLQTMNTCFQFLDLPLMDSIVEQHLNPTVLLRNPDKYHKNLNYLYGKNPVKTFLKKIIPTSMGQMIRRKVTRQLFTTNKTEMSYPEMTEAERAWLASFYQDDITLLKELTGLSFYRWKDFQ
jgi:hypothetical protein